MAAGVAAGRTRYPEHGAAPAAALGDVKTAQAEQQAARLALETAVVRTYIKLAYACALHEPAADALQQRRRLHVLAERRHAASLSGAHEAAALAATLPAGEREQQQAMAALLRHQLAALIGQR